MINITLLYDQLPNLQSISSRIKEVKRRIQSQNKFNIRKSRKLFLPLWYRWYELVFRLTLLH